MIVRFRIFAPLVLIRYADYFSDMSRRYACLAIVNAHRPCRRAEESWLILDRKTQVAECDFGICPIDDCPISQFCHFFLIRSTDYLSDVSRRYACLAVVNAHRPCRRAEESWLVLDRKTQVAKIRFQHLSYRWLWLSDIALFPPWLYDWRTTTSLMWGVQKCDFGICPIDDCPISHFCHLSVRFRLSDQK